MKTWIELHSASEAAAIEAEKASREGRKNDAVVLYSESAKLEQEALFVVNPTKTRTKGITAVSAVALWYKAADYDQAEQLAYAMLADPATPQFARVELRNLVQAIWTESAKQAAQITFLPGQVLVSVKGGEVITGGAPLDLIVEKVQTIQAMFYRTVEYIRDMPLRPRGGPIKEIQDSCRPWLFQAAPGSYQFSVAIQQPHQMDLFQKPLEPSLVAQQFFDILTATASKDAEPLSALVPEIDYRNAFLKLSRNLAPTGKTFDSIEFRAGTGAPPIALTSESRAHINKALKSSRPPSQEEGEGTREEHVGILRAVDLENDFLKVVVEHETLQVVGLEDAMDDVIGPMVNKRVKLTMLRKPKQLRFLDIELDD